MAAEWEIVVWHQAKLDVAMKSIVSETVSFTEDSKTDSAQTNEEGVFVMAEGGIGGGAMQSEAEQFNILEIEDGAVYGVFEKTVYISDPRFFQSSSGGKKNIKPRLES